MKRLFLILFLNFILQLDAQNVKIIGNITDDKSEVVLLSPAISSKLIDSKIETSLRKGYFEFNISISTPCFYRLYYRDKRVSLYLEPNSTIQMSIDNSKTENFVNFYSDLIAENMMLNQKEIPTLGGKELRAQCEDLAKKGENEYKIGINQIIIDKRNAFKQLAKDNQCSSDFIRLYDFNHFDMGGLIYQSYFPRFAYGNMDSFYALNPDKLNIYQILKDDALSINSALYYENQMSHLKYKTNLNYKDKIVSRSTDDLELYKAYIKNLGSYPAGKVKELLYENLIGEWVSYYGRTVDIKDEIVDFVTQVQDPKKREVVKKRLVSLAQYESGKPAPIFSFEDNAGNVRNLKEFIGKIVYIDAWASWCGPCIAELPYSHEVYEKYKNNPDIQFLYISIDDKKENWQKALRDRSLNDGIQGIAFPNGFNSDFARKYSIQGIPNYILIDKSGNLVSHRAPHPSQKDKIYPLLDKLLGVK